MVGVLCCCGRFKESESFLIVGLGTATEEVDAAFGMMKDCTSFLGTSALAGCCGFNSSGFEGGRGGLLFGGVSAGRLGGGLEGFSIAALVRKTGGLLGNSVVVALLIRVLCGLVGNEGLPPADPPGVGGSDFSPGVVGNCLLPP